MPPAGARHNLLEVAGLRVGFRTHSGFQEAVRNVSFRIPPGKTVALVGESGSGKSVISQSIMGILPGPATSSAARSPSGTRSRPRRRSTSRRCRGSGPRCRRCAAAGSA